MLISVPHLATPFKVILYTPLVKADQSGKKKKLYFLRNINGNSLSILLSEQFKLNAVCLALEGRLQLCCNPILYFLERVGTTSAYLFLCRT